MFFRVYVIKELNICKKKNYYKNYIIQIGILRNKMKYKKIII